MKKKVCGIYIIFNHKSGHAYIGQSRDIYERWRWHKSHLKCGNHSNRRLQNSWNKYGAEAFDFYLLDLCEEKKLNKLETQWVKNYSGVIELYNLGATGCSHTMSKETRNKISQALKERYTKELNSMYGKKHTKEWREMMSLKMRGKNAYWYGKHRSKKTNKKIAQSLLGRKASEESKLKKSVAVYQLDLEKKPIKLWKSMRSAQDELGIRSSSISQACLKGYKAGDFYWRYANA